MLADALVLGRQLHIIPEEATEVIVITGEDRIFFALELEFSICLEPLPGHELAYPVISEPRTGKRRIIKAEGTHIRFQPGLDRSATPHIWISKPLQAIFDEPFQLIAADYLVERAKPEAKPEPQKAVNFKIDAYPFAAQLLGDSLKMLHWSILSAFSRRSLSSA